MEGGLGGGGGRGGGGGGGGSSSTCRMWPVVAENENIKTKSRKPCVGLRKNGACDKR